MKILVCGDRNWSNQKRMYDFLDEIDGYGICDNSKKKVYRVIEGEARGADTMARLWAESRNINVEPHPANWARYGRGAGPIRNREMLKSQPDLVIAFHNYIKTSKGTLDMLKVALKAGISCILVTDTTSNKLEKL